MKLSKNQRRAVTWVGALAFVVGLCAVVYFVVKKSGAFATTPTQATAKGTTSKPKRNSDEDQAPPARSAMAPIAATMTDVVKGTPPVDERATVSTSDTMGPLSRNAKLKPMRAHFPEGAAAPPETLNPSPAHENAFEKQFPETLSVKASDIAKAAFTGALQNIRGANTFQGNRHRGFQNDTFRDACGSKPVRPVMDGCQTWFGRNELYDAAIADTPRVQ